jgi:hypothetical protein
MRSKLRGHLTYANVLATLALFIALGGSSYAALTLTNNVVRSKHIKNGEVKNGDLGAGAVTAPKVKNGSLRAEDFGPGQLPAGPQGLKGDQGDPGAPGAPGGKGDKGDTGSPTLTSGYVPMTATVDPGTTTALLSVGPITYTANCKLISGSVFRLEIRISSNEAGAIAASRLDHLDLTGTPQRFWFAENAAGELSSQPTEVITPSGTGHHRSDVIVGVHKFSADCIARVDADT